MWPAAKCHWMEELIIGIGFPDSVEISGARFRTINYTLYIDGRICIVSVAYTIQQKNLLHFWTRLEVLLLNWIYLGQDFMFFGEHMWISLENFTRTWKKLIWGWETHWSFCSVSASLSQSLHYQISDLVVEPPKKFIDAFSELELAHAGGDSAIFRSKSLSIMHVILF